MLRSSAAAQLASQAAKKAAPKSDQQTGTEKLAEAGRAFGVRLGGVLATE